MSDMVHGLRMIGLLWSSHVI